MNARPLLWALTMGRTSQSFLDAGWVAGLMAATPGAARPEMARRLLALSPHYFTTPRGGRSRQAHRADECRRIAASRQRIFDALLAPRLPADAVVLDYGCGPGFLSAILARHAAHVYAVDVSRGALACAAALNAAPNLRYLRANAGDLAAIPDGGVDLACSLAVAQHLPDTVLADVLATMRSKLKPGGLLLCHVQLDDAAWRTEDGWRTDRSAVGRLRFRYGLHCFRRSHAVVLGLLTAAGFVDATLLPMASLTDVPDDDDVWRPACGGGAPTRVSGGGARSDVRDGRGGMRRFASLFAELDATNATSLKVDAVARYLASVPPEDAAWAVFFLLGRRFTRLLPRRAVGGWIVAATGVPEWLLGECYAAVGDGAETAALLLDQLPPVRTTTLSLPDWVQTRILPLGGLPADLQRTRVLAWMAELDRVERFTLLKMLTGELRLGLSHTLAVRAIAQAARLPATTIAARLMGDWTPDAAWYQRLVDPGVTDVDHSRPYPFCLASPLDGADDAGGGLDAVLDDPGAWMAEWKWDGIRAQLVQRTGRVWLWSRGEELITARFPEIAASAAFLPGGTVLDGEILAFRDGLPLPFSALQQRIGRERQVARLARDVPAVFMAFDVLEHGGVDVRGERLEARRRTLDRLIADVSRHALTPIRASVHEPPRLPFDEPGDAEANAPAPLQASPLLDVQTWVDAAALRRTSRARRVEGLMIKRRVSAYGVGRRRGDWWKWKIGPHTIDAVLIYAQPGSGKRASLLTDYTFGLWDGGELGTGGQGTPGSPTRRSGAGPLDPAPHGGPVRAGAARRASAGVRAGVRGRGALQPPPVRRRRPLSAHVALADGQAAGRGGYAGVAAAAGAGGRIVSAHATGRGPGASRVRSPTIVGARDRPRASGRGAQRLADRRQQQGRVVGLLEEGRGAHRVRLFLEPRLLARRHHDELHRRRHHVLHALRHQEAPPPGRPRSRMTRSGFSLTATATAWTASAAECTS
ncbi:MAG: methyltransferase domain-containing protein [Vicinamibacterales bacterium]